MLLWMLFTALARISLALVSDREDQLRVYADEEVLDREKWPFVTPIVNEA